MHRIKSKYLWDTCTYGTENPLCLGRHQPQDIIRHHQGVTADGNMQTIKATFELYFTPETLDTIMMESNREATRVVTEWNSAHPENKINWIYTNIPELKAFIGLLIFAGGKRANLEPIDELWSTDNGRPIFIATMISLTHNRFKELLRFLRFDNKQTRAERRALDRLAPFRDI